MDTKPMAEMILRMNVGSCYIPKRNSTHPRGDDALFICKHRQMFGVADGVGGWANQGIDAGEYARQLMNNCLLQAQAGVYPRKVLEEAYSRTEAKGSATACIIKLHYNYLKVVNVGDSGFMLFRNGHMIYKSPIQQHNFNYPYQLGKRSRCNNPSVAEEIVLEVRPGDVIVAGTESLFDNMFAFEMEELLKIDDGGALDPEELAWLIAEHATAKSMDRDGDSPFSRAAAMEGLVRRGGKDDDVTVVVARILTPHQFIQS